MRFKQQPGVYCISIKSPSKTYKYIGQSINVSQRIRHHKSSIKGNRHKNKYLQHVYDKYQNIEYKLLQYCEEVYLNILEQVYINMVNSKECLNIMSVDMSKGHIMPEKVKDKISASLKGKLKSKEWKEKISKAHIGKYKSKEAVQKVSKYWKEILKNRPWKNSRANLQVWSLAKDIYQLRKEGIPMTKISNQLNIPYSSLIKIGKKLNQGWNPTTDKYWIQDFKN